MTMNVVCIIKDRLENLVQDYEHYRDNDYMGLYHLKAKGNNVKTILPSEIDDRKQEIADADLAFFLSYPYDPISAKKLQELEKETTFINSPTGVLATSEKTFELEHLARYLPETILINGKTRLETIAAFIQEHQKAIIKPINGTGGKGIELLGEEDMERAYKLSRKQAMILQQYIPNDGDRRVLCYNGQIIGHYGRYNEHKVVNNIGAGGHITNGLLSKKEETVSLAVAKLLLEHDVYFIGVDLIGEKLLEVNTASPGGLYDVFGNDPAERERRLALFLRETYKLGNK